MRNGCGVFRGNSGEAFMSKWEILFMESFIEISQEIF